MSKLRILLAEDHTLVRHGVRRILETQPDWTVVGEAGDGREAVRLALELQPDLAIIDVAMPLLNGVEVTRQVVRRVPGIRTIALSVYSDEAYVTQALKAGAHGYLLKDSADKDLISAVKSVMAGNSFFSPAVARVMLDDYVRHMGERGSPDRFDALTERERETLQLVAEGHSNKAIGELLGISPATVETHRAHVLQKLDLHSTAELILYAVRRGIVTPTRQNAPPDLGPTS